VGRRPPMPGPAERARTIAAVGPATLMPPGGESNAADKVTPLLHHVHADGAVTVLLPDDHALVREDAPALAEIVDLAPVPLREPVRGLLWIGGWLRVLSGADARAEAVRVAETRADPRLLDLGHGATMLRLEPVSLVLADAEGTCPVALADFAAARPDPFCAEEAGWLRHLELSHTDVVGMLARHLPDQLRGGHIRPLGLDRYGLRLRVEALDDDHDVRLAFSRPIGTAAELGGELRRLVGCPFLAQRVDRQLDRPGDGHDGEEGGRRDAPVLDLAQRLDRDPGRRGDLHCRALPPGRAELLAEANAALAVLRRERWPYHGANSNTVIRIPAWWS
jgi:hypothetical protein